MLPFNQTLFSGERFKRKSLKISGADLNSKSRVIFFIGVIFGKFLGVYGHVDE